VLRKMAAFTCGVEALHPTSTECLVKILFETNTDTDYDSGYHRDMDLGEQFSILLGQNAWSPLHLLRNKLF
jgi:hypothetical protein